MSCSCPQTDFDLAQRVLTDDADELVVCDAAYANLVRLQFGANATAGTHPQYEVHRGNPLMSSTPVPVCAVKPGLTHE